MKVDYYNCLCCGKVLQTPCSLQDTKNKFCSECEKAIDTKSKNELEWLTEKQNIKKELYGNNKTKL